MVPPSRASIALLILAAVLTGCADAPDWVRPGQTAANNSRDYEDCQREAQLTVWNRTEIAAPFPTPGVTPMDDPGLVGQPRGYPYGRNDPAYRLRLDRALEQGPEIRRQLMSECLSAKGFAPAPN